MNTVDTPTPVAEPANRLFVGNLSFRTTDQDLSQSFASAGEIKSAFVITRGRRSLGYGFVEFVHAADAESAVEKFKELKIIDREVKLELAKNRDNTRPREERNQSAGDNQENQGNTDNQDQVPQRRRNRRNKNRNRNRSRDNQDGFNNFNSNFTSNIFPANNNWNQSPQSQQYMNRSYGSVVKGANGSFIPNQNFGNNRNFNQNQNFNNYNQNQNFNNYNPNFNQNQNFNNFNQNQNQNQNFTNYNSNQFSGQGARRGRGRNPRVNNGNINNNMGMNMMNMGMNSGNLNDNDNANSNANNQRQQRRRPRQDQGDKVPSTTTLYVTNLPFSVNDDGLLAIFKEFNPKSAHIVFTRTGRSRGYGFVEFEDETTQQKALEAKNGEKVKCGEGDKDDRPIVVSVSHSSGKLASDDNPTNQSNQ